MRKFTRLLCVAPGPGHTRAPEQARGLQSGFGAKAGAPAAVCESDGTRDGRTFGAVGERAPLHYFNRLLSVVFAPVGGVFAQACDGAVGAASCVCLGKLNS
jgi:hypothetical protein